MEFESHELLRGRGRMHPGEDRRRVVVVVERGCDPVLRGKIGDLLGLEDAAAFRRVRVANGYRFFLEQLLESSGEVDILAGPVRLLQEFLIRSRSSAYIQGTVSSSQAKLNLSTVWANLINVFDVEAAVMVVAMGILQPTFSRTAAQ